MALKPSFLCVAVLACCASLAAPSTQAATHRHVRRAAVRQEAALTPEQAFQALERLPVNARHALVLEEGSGRIILTKDADTVVPIASLTKLVTAMVVLDAKQDPNELVKIDREDVDTLKHSASFLRVGSEMSRLSALKLALMCSENRAASVLARTYPGGLPAFALAVKAKLRALGLAHTSIGEPTGLAPTNTSTATEMAKIAVAASRYPEIARITSDKADKIAINGRPREFHNTDHLVGNKGWDILLSKTGYTEEAGRCLTLRMKSGEKNFTVVLLDADGSSQRISDAVKIKRSLEKLPV